jgi:hypothetical protein
MAHHPFATDENDGTSIDLRNGRSMWSALVVHSTLILRQGVHRIPWNTFLRKMSAGIRYSHYGYSTVFGQICSLPAQMDPQELCCVYGVRSEVRTEDYGSSSKWVEGGVT